MGSFEQQQQKSEVCYCCYYLLLGKVFVHDGCKTIKHFPTDKRQNEKHFQQKQKCKNTEYGIESINTTISIRSFQRNCDIACDDSRLEFLGRSTHCTRLTKINFEKC